MLIAFAVALAVPGALNPDVTQTTVGQTICVPGWAATVRPPKAYTEAIKRKLVTRGKLAAYELDHAVPLSLGGAPSDRNNLWAEKIVEAKRKDRIEIRLHSLVCKATLTLAAARAASWPHWRAAYRRFITNAH